MTDIKRLVLHELRERARTTQEVAEASGLSNAEVVYQVQDLNERLRCVLGKSDDPVSVNANGGWRVEGVAGLLRLNQQVELEVVPKFLDPKNSTWRSDFFLLALLVRTGHLLHHDEISADSGDRGDLATLVARALLRMCDENSRRPIRRYKKSRFSDFSIDGDVEWETIVLPDPDGFTISAITLTDRNECNATIRAAVDILVREVSDTDTVAGLERLARQLGNQGAPPTVFPTLPQRHLGWNGAYSLARLVVEGLGLDLASGRFDGPGFVLSTWQSWEQLCFEIIRRALQGNRVVAQQGWVLGRRGAKNVLAFPDISPHLMQDTNFLLDAKYKVPRGRLQHIDRADVNEAITFLHAAGRSEIDLLYPSSKPVESLPLGEWSVFDNLITQREAWVIRGIEIQIQGIARKGGFEQVIKAARRALAHRLELKKSTRE